MALCRTCHTVIPCHCHLNPPTQIRPGVYVAGARDTDQETPRELPCSRAVLRRSHEPHGWSPQPGMDPVDCPGYEAPSR